MWNRVDRKKKQLARTHAIMATKMRQKKAKLILLVKKWKNQDLNGI